MGRKEAMAAHGDGRILLLACSSLPEAAEVHWDVATGNTPWLPGAEESARALEWPHGEKQRKQR